MKTQRGITSHFAVFLLGLLCGFLLTVPLPSRAQDITEGVGLVCDTATQVEQYAAFADQKGVQVALEEVNSEDMVCGVLHVRFTLHEQVKRVNIRGAEFDIRRISVIAAEADGVWLIFPTPDDQFTIFTATGTGT